MTPVTEPAHFIRDPESGRYLPANKVATNLADQMSRMWLTEAQILTIKSRGYRVTKPNEEPIDAGVTA